MEKDVTLKRPYFLVLVVILMLAFSSVASFAEEVNTLVSITADYWMPGIDANIKSSELGAIGTDIDIIDDLGFDDSENIPSIKASIDLPFLPELVVSYFKIDGSASKTITKNITYKGYSYTAAGNVTSKYDITHYEAFLQFNLLNQDFGKLGFLVGAKYFEVDTELKETATGTTNTESVDGPVPIIGIAAGIKLPAKFRFEAMARGLSLEIGDIDAALYDIEAALHYDFNRFIRASVGYRYFLIDGEDTSTNDSVDIKFAGPFLGITGSF